jgi:gamma-glutamylcyclotransferase (GGCT)/AIG2-like uncharacterized protein YtfP
MLTKQDVLYFAYGSNLNEADLRRWCRENSEPYPLGPPVARAYLPDTQLVFNYASPSRGGGTLNIRHRLGQAVQGALYHMSPEGWEVLDRKEGAPRVYKQLDILALTEDGREHSAVTYQVEASRAEGTFVRPAAEYVQIVHDGLATLGFTDCMLRPVSHGKEPPWCIDKLFVYGTLMEGEIRHPILENWCDHLAGIRATAPGLLFDSGKNFPAMFPAERAGQEVRGELYPVVDLKKAFEMLDIVETVRRYGSTGSLFRRAVLRVRAEDGNSYVAWAYLYDGTPAGMTPIPSGNWLEVPHERLPEE